MARDVIHDLWQDFRLAVRSLRRAPLFASIVIGTLAVGIGVNTTMFSVVDGVLMRPLPYPAAERLHFLGVRTQYGNSTFGVRSYEYWALRDGVGAIEDLGVYDWGGGTLTGDGGRPEEPTSLSIDPGFQEVTGLTPLLGRRFTEEDCTPGANAVVLLGEEIWRRRYNADPNVIGRSVLLDEVPHEVVGIVPASFRFPDETGALQVFRPRAMARNIDYRSLGLVARLAPDATEIVAEAQLAPVAAGLAEQYPERNAKRSFYLVSFEEQALGNVRASLLLLWAAVGFVLLLACMNAANMLLSRAAAKSHDVAVCAAMGAGRYRILQRVLSESLLLALIAAALGLLLAQIGIEVIGELGLAELPRATEIGIDLRVFAFTLVLAVLAGLLYGVIPGWQLGRIDLTEMMKEGGSRASIGPAGQRIRATLTVAEVAVACVLLVSAGLMIRSALELRATEPGFDHENVLGLTMWADQPPDTDAGWPVRFYDDVLERVEALPGVLSASMVNGMPWQNMFNFATEIRIEGHAAFADDEPALIRYRTVSEDYLEEMGVPLLRGRHLERSDGTDHPSVAVVSELFAERFWPGDDAIGKRIQVGDEREETHIVGVVGDVRERRLDEAPEPMVYLPFRQQPSVAMTLMVRTEGDPELRQLAVQQAVWEVSPTQGIWRTRTLDALLRQGFARETLYLRLLVAFALVAVLLAAAGIYGVISFSVARRTHEIGIRMALGAGHPEIVRRVLGRGLGLSAVGLLLGLPAAYAAARVLRSLLYGVGVLDVATYVAVAALVFAAAALACYLPAYRATRVQPAASLRVD